jgi:hypothetical protein
MNLHNMLLTSKLRGGSGGSQVADQNLKDFLEGTTNVLNTETLTKVGDSVFAGTHVKSVNLPNVTSVGINGFMDCIQLEDVTLPSAVDIGESSFMSCSALTSVDIPSAVSVDAMTFYDCTKFSSINAPNLTNIGDSCFTSCVKLTDVHFPKVTNVGVAAFGRCTGLKKITFDSVVTIGDAVFSGATSLESVIFRTTDGVCIASEESTKNSPLLTGGAFVYIPSSMWDIYAYAYGDYIVMFRKIEDYPEICGEA